MSQTIDDFICNLIAGRKVITGLYTALDTARNTVNIKFYRYTFTYPGLGKKQYKGEELRTLYCESCNLTYEELCADVTDIDNIVRLLFKAQTTLLPFYQAELKALAMKDMARQYFYTFRNPFQCDCLDLNLICRKFCRDELIKFFCQCKNKEFVDIFTNC